MEDFESEQTKQALYAAFESGDTRAKAEGVITVRLGYRPPYRFAALLRFFGDRALEGIELVEDDSYARTVRIMQEDGSIVSGWLRVEDDAAHNALALTISDSLLPAISTVVARIRRQFDVDCNPQPITPAIASLDEHMPGAVVEGTRLPGCFDPFETTCRAILGQQVSVKAANRLAARVVAQYGTEVETGIPGLERAFPTPDEILALTPLEEAFGPLGVIGTRSRTIAEVARQLRDGRLQLSSEAIVAEQMESLLSIKGIGPWTANYIAMRALSYPDAFLETDAGVAHALPDLTPKERLALAEAWHPWRSYAVISMWNAL